LNGRRVNLAKNLLSPLRGLPGSLDVDLLMVGKKLEIMSTFPRGAPA
jgi:hypothetical protein